MREITKQMIDEFRIYELGYDFMGYESQGDILNFHHLVVPRRLCQDREDRGYYKENGAILYETPHRYLHIIEAYDREMFDVITNQMVKINRQGFIDVSNLRYIDDCLSYFEKEHSSDRTNKGRMLIKDEFLRRNKF